MIKKYNEFIKEDVQNYSEPSVKIGDVIDVFDEETNQFTKISVEDMEEEIDADGTNFTNIESENAHILWDNSNKRWRIEEWYK